MTYRKRTVLGLILLLLAVFAVYSCWVVYGIRRKEPSRAKLVIAWEAAVPSCVLYCRHTGLFHEHI